jgi:hypothetical protein
VSADRIALMVANTAVKRIKKSSRARGGGIRDSLSVKPKGRGCREKGGRSGGFNDVTVGCRQRDVPLYVGIRTQACSDPESASAKE